MTITIREATKNDVSTIMEMLIVSLKDFCFIQNGNLLNFLRALLNIQMYRLGRIFLWKVRE